MKYLAVLCISLFCTLQTFAQQDYFVYLQTDNSQAFYIRMNGKVFSSTAAGYLILSKVADSSLTVTIGFPKNLYPEQQFSIPASHKDAGYLLKNFSDKGWGLFNLQTAAIIMTQTVPEEKKKTEITGVRKNDAFSMLLANAVNDTAVLYTVVRPPKPAPPVLIAEKTKDSLAEATVAAKKDSVIIVKKQPAKKDSGVVAKQNRQQQADNTPKTTTHLLKGKTTVAAAKNVKQARDSVAVSTSPVVKKDSTVTAETVAVNKKDSFPTARPTATAVKGKNAIAKNNKQRKDTIIIMNGNSSAPDKSVAVKKEKLTAGKDSVQIIRKEIMQAPEEKRDALQNNKGAVIIQKVPVKKDSSAAANPKKDTIEAVVKNEPVKTAQENKDSIFNQPQKRLRPLVNKAAELFTDTSYIAVFVDESKEKFDTIRISIPFNEAMAFAKLQKPAIKLPDAAAVEKGKDSVITAVNIPSAPSRTNDTVVTGITVKDKIATEKSKQTDSIVLKVETAAKKINDSDANHQEPVSSPVKIDSTGVEKKTTDSLQQPVAPITIKKDSTVTVGNPPVLKRDSAAALPKDSSAAAKTTKPPLLLMNSDCREVAADADIDKLRIKMLLVSSDEDRIALAKKILKQKCFLAKQVGALSELFKTDEGKYKWFDAAYPYISDSGNFSSLGELIKDEYYLNRFKAMLRH